MPDIFPASPLLVVEGLQATYNHAVVALRGIDLVVRTGEILALLGSNGAGKTTTLKAVSNLLAADRGQILAGSLRYDGIDITATKPSDLVRRGLVPVLEGRHVFRSLTVEENLVTGGLGRSGSPAEIAADLERIYGYFPRLRDKRSTSAGLTSGGEQQMTAIGRALMSRPRLLVLDEPSMGLAPLVVQDIFATLARLNREEGLTLLVAEQNAAVALRHAHRAAIIENGAVVLEGAAAELRGRGDLKEFYLGRAGLHAERPAA